MKKVFFTLLLVVFSGTLFVSATESGKLSSLCDEWHMIVYPFMDVLESPSTYTQRLTSDTIINAVSYFKLQKNEKYIGALREGNNRDIYYIPADTTHEYLLYAFNAQIGDTLTNLWIGSDAREYQECFQDGNCTAVVEAISDDKTRVFDLQTIEDNVISGPLQRWTWREGVGLAQGPVNLFFPVNVADPNPEVLCAYKGGKRVYAKDDAKNYDCCHESSDVIQATKWYCVDMNYDLPTSTSSYSAVSYHLQGDTIFGETTYQVLRRKDGVYCGALRKSADGKQVYYRPGELNGTYEPSLGKEYLLYDFDVQAGDTVYAYNGFMDTSCEQEGESVMAKCAVVSVNIKGGRKIVRVKNEQEKEIEWIEGIGTRNILFSKTMHCLTGYDSFWTLCATDDEGNTLYSFDTDHLGIRNNCPNWEILAVENVQSNKVQSTKFFRNGQLLIECNGKTYNAQGMEVRQLQP